MKTCIKSVTVMASVLLACTAFAQEMKVLKSDPGVSAEWVSDKEIGMNAVLLHFTGDPISSMSFAVPLPEGVGSANLKGCVSDLPKTHTGACSVVDNELRVVVYSMTNESLEPQTLGFVSFAKAPAMNDGDALQVTKVDAARAERQ